MKNEKNHLFSIDFLISDRDEQLIFITSHFTPSFCCCIHCSLRLFSARNIFNSIFFQKVCSINKQNVEIKMKNLGEICFIFVCWKCEMDAGMREKRPIIYNANVKTSSFGTIAMAPLPHTHLDGTLFLIKRFSAFVKKKAQLPLELFEYRSCRRRRCVVWMKHWDLSECWSCSLLFPFASIFRWSLF